MNITNIEKILEDYNKDINNIQQIDETKDVLDILYKNQIIIMNKQGKLKKKAKDKVYIGKLQKKEGFGFVVVNNVQDFYVRNTDKYMDGDEVLIILTDEKGRSRTAKIIDVINRGQEYLLIKKTKNGNFEYVGPDLGYKIYIKGLDYEQIKPGAILSVNVLDVKKNKLITTLKNIIADENDPDIDMKLVLDKYEIEVDFPQKVDQELNKIEEEISKEEISTRKNLKDQIFFTIDGSDSKDLDDAISLIKDNKGYTLYVAIADVSHYIKRGSALGDAAQDRATSVYFIDRVVPMLPKKISNGICSLHPGVDRLVLVCQMRVDLKGNVQNIKVYEGVINSKYKMSYKDVNNMILRHDKKLISKYLDIYGILIEMNKLAKILNKNRIKRGAFNLEDSEAKFKLDEDQNIIDIYPYQREDAEKLIEEFMILANESVTKFANDKNSEFIYRVHGHPNPNKLKELKNLLIHLNIQVNLDYENLDPHDFKYILDSVDSEIFKRALSKMIVRSMQKAIYSTNNIGHFGLASQNYTHFTSPIRRYPDLEVHRILKNLISKNSKPTSVAELEYVCDHSSKKEVKAIKAEQEIEDRKKTEYMKNYVGHFFRGRVTSIEEYGMFVELDNTIRGLIRFKWIEEYEENTSYKVKFKEKKDLNLGDEIQVEVLSVNIARGLVDFFPKGFIRKEENSIAKPPRHNLRRKEESTNSSKRSKSRRKKLNKKRSSKKEVSKNDNSKNKFKNDKRINNKSQKKTKNKTEGKL